MLHSTAVNCHDIQLMFFHNIKTEKILPQLRKQRSLYINYTLSVFVVLNFAKLFPSLNIIFLTKLQFILALNILFRNPNKMFNAFSLHFPLHYHKMYNLAKPFFLVYNKKICQLLKVTRNPHFLYNIL